MNSNLKDNLDAYTMVVFRKAQKTIDDKTISKLKELGLTHTQFGVLDILYTKGEMKIGELIEKMLTTSGNMTFVVKNMENAELVYRRQCPFDKRSFKIGLTEKGRALIEKVLPIHLENVKNILSVLSDEDKKTLITILKKFKEENGGQ